MKKPNRIKFIFVLQLCLVDTRVVKSYHLDNSCGTDMLELRDLGNNKTIQATLQSLLGFGLKLTCHLL